MMTALFVFLMALVGPLLVARWRFSLIGLAAQGALLAWMAFHREWSASTLILLTDCALVRTWMAPVLLARIQTRVKAPRRNDILPPNLFSWVMAGMLVLLAFRFAFTVLPSDTTAATHLAVAASGVLLGLLVLATQDSAFGQIVGFLRIENAIALFELGSTEQLPAAVQAALAAVFLLTVLTLALFLQRLAGVAGDPPLTEAPPTI